MTDISVAVRQEAEALSAHAQLPPASAILRQARRRRRWRTAAPVTAVAASLVAVSTLLTSGISAPDRLDGSVAAPVPAAPSEARLRQVFAALQPPVVFGPVQQMTPSTVPADGLGDQPRATTAGVTSQTIDNYLSVSWAVVEPALTDAEAVDIARSVSGSGPAEEGRTVATGSSQSGSIRSVAFRFDSGSFIRIWAWSSDGGVASITSGLGASTADERVAALEDAARALLSSGR